MTGYSSDYSFDRVFDAGAQEFIKKPFAAEQVDNRLKRIFHERRLVKENEALQKHQTELNEQLKALLSVAADLTSELDFDRLFPLIIGKISEAMNVERTSLYVIDWEKRELWTRVSEGIAPLKIRLGEGISGRVAQTGEMMRVGDAQDLPYFNREFDKQHKFTTRSVLCIPIYNRMGDRFAVIQVINKNGAAGFNDKDIGFLTGLGSQVGIALENAILYDEIRLSFESFIRTLSAVVDARHPLTAGHSQRVTEYSMMIAEQMGMAEPQREVLKIAALLHDIGKIGVRDDVLMKNGPFTPEEREEMNTHPAKTKEILEKFRFPKALRKVPEIALYHHERINGQGYPFGLTGDKMPLESKIMAAADVFDALTSRRDYPKYTCSESYSCEPMPLAKAIAILKSDAGSHFDPAVIDAFMACLPQALLRFRGGHFSPRYVDDTLRQLAPDLIEPKP
jgi:putative nucleotidyltransferase with HDIG domain